MYKVKGDLKNKKFKRKRRNYNGKNKKRMA